MSARERAMYDLPLRKIRAYPWALSFVIASVRPLAKIEERADASMFRAVSIEYLSLECVRASLLTTARGLRRALARDGWKLVRRAPPAHHEFREIALCRDGAWTSLHEVGHESPLQEYTARVATSGIDASSPAVGISVRSWTDDGTFRIERIAPSAASTAESLVYAPKAGVSTRVRAPLLADLAVKTNRATLTKGVMVSPFDADEGARTIAKLAGLPPLRARHVAFESDLILRFHRPRRRPMLVVPARSLDPKSVEAKPANVGFRDSFHVPDLEHGQLLRAVVALCQEHEMAPDLGPDRRRTHFFVTRDRWQSFGEVLHDGDFLTVPINWGALLSQRLERPVLLVRAHETWIELALFVDGKRQTVVTGKPKTKIDLSPLAPILPPQKCDAVLSRKIALSKGMSRLDIAAVIGEPLDLSMPVLEGRMDGVIIPFGVMKTVMRSAQAPREA